MSVKTLRRITQQQRNIVSGTDAPQSTVLGRLFNSAGEEGSEFLHNMGRHRKSADDLPLSTVDRIKESIVFNAPALAAAMDKGTLMSLLSKLKLPIMITLGIAAIAAIAYLAYRLYTHYTSKKREETIDTIMKDIEATAPDLVNIEGWRESIRNEVEEAVSAKDAQHMVAKVAEIKANVIKHQQSINPTNVGSGINVFRHLPMHPVHTCNDDHHARELPRDLRNPRQKNGRGLRKPM